MSKSLSDCCKNMNNLRERPIPPHPKGWGLLGLRVEKLVYDPTIPRYSSKESVIIPQAEDADSLSFMLEYLCDDPNDNRDPEIDIAKKVLRRYLAAIEGAKP